MGETQVESRSKVFEEIENSLAGRIGERVLVVKRGIRYSKRSSDGVAVASWNFEEWFLGRLNAEVLLIEPDCRIIFVPVKMHVWAQFPHSKEQVLCRTVTTPIRLNALDENGAIEMVVPPQVTFDASVRTASSRSIQVVISDEPIRSFVINKGGRAAQLYFHLNARLFREE